MDDEAADMLAVRELLALPPTVGWGVERLRKDGSYEVYIYRPTGSSSAGGPTLAAAVAAAVNPGEDTGG